MLTDNRYAWTRHVKGQRTHTRACLTRRQVVVDSDDSDDSNISSDVDVSVDHGRVEAEAEKLRVQAAIAMHDLGLENRDRITKRDIGGQCDRILPAHRLFANRECNREGTEQAERARANRKELAAWGNFKNTTAALADVEDLPDINSGQTHRAKIQAVIAQEKEDNGGELDWDAADNYRGGRGGRDGGRGRGGGAGGGQGGGGGTVERGGGISGSPIYGAPGSPAHPHVRRLGSAVDPDRPYIYRTKCGDIAKYVLYSSHSLQNKNQAPEKIRSRGPKVPTQLCNPRSGGISQRGHSTFVEDGVRMGGGTGLDPALQRHHNDPTTKRRGRGQRNVRQGRPPLPGWLKLALNQPASAVTSSQDLKIVATTAISPSPGQQPIDALIQISATSPMPQQAAPTQSQTQPVPVPLSQRQPKSAPTIHLELPQKPLRSTVANVERSRSKKPSENLSDNNSFIQSIGQIDFTKIGNGTPKRATLAPGSKADNLQKMQLSTINTTLAPTTAPPECRIRAVPTSEITLPPPHRSGARPGEASLWTDPNSSPVSFSSSQSSLAPSPVVESGNLMSPESVVDNNGPQLTRLRISVPPESVSRVDCQISSTENVAISPTGQRVDLMDGDIEFVNKSPLEPQPWIEPALSGRQPDLSEYRSAPAANLSVVVNGYKLCSSALGGGIGDHNLPGRSSSAAESPPLEPPTSSWAASSKLRGGRDRRSRENHPETGLSELSNTIEPSAAQNFKISKSEPQCSRSVMMSMAPQPQSQVTQIFVNPFKQFGDEQGYSCSLEQDAAPIRTITEATLRHQESGTAATGSTRENNLSDLEAAENAVIGNKLFGDTNAGIYPAHETLEQRMVRLLNGGAGAGLIPFGGASARPITQTAVQSVTCCSSSPHRKENLIGSKYANNPTKVVAAPRALADLSTNGSSPKKPKFVTSIGETAQDTKHPHRGFAASSSLDWPQKGLEFQSSSLQPSAGTIFGDHKVLQSKNHALQPTSSHNTRIMRGMPGPGFDWLVNDVKSKVVSLGVSAGSAGIIGGAGPAQTDLRPSESSVAAQSTQGAANLNVTTRVANGYGVDADDASEDLES